jgi:hypothetical protein
MLLMLGSSSAGDLIACIADCWLQENINDFRFRIGVDIIKVLLLLLLLLLLLPLPHLACAMPLVCRARSRCRRDDLSVDALLCPLRIIP